MAFTASTGEHKVTRSDIFLVDPRALIVEWSKNLSRGGLEPIVDDGLIELARDMLPKKGQGDSEDGTSGQLNPILTRPLPDRRLEVVGGFRRMRAALWLIESGTCPDFKVKYTVSRLSDAEAALINVSENLQREDPKPIQMAHAIRALHEDYGLSFAQIGKRLKRSDSWVANILNLVMLPSAIQASVASGSTPVAAALELAKLPGTEQVAVFNQLNEGGERVTAARVKSSRSTAAGAIQTAVPRTLAEFRKFLKGNSQDPLAATVTRWLDGSADNAELEEKWFARFG